MLMLMMIMQYLSEQLPFSIHFFFSKASHDTDQFDRESMLGMPLAVVALTIIVNIVYVRTA